MFPEKQVSMLELFLKDHVTLKILVEVTDAEHSALPSQE